MGRQKEIAYIFILLSLVSISVSRPSIRDKRAIVKDYGPFKSSTPHQFEKREDGKYYLKEEHLDSRKSSIEYVTPKVNQTEKVTDNQRTPQDAQVSTEDTEEKNFMSLQTLDSETIKKKAELSKEIVSSTEESGMDSVHSKEDEKEDEKMKMKKIIPRKPLSKDLEKDETKAAIDGFQKSKENEENFKLKEEMETKNRKDEEKPLDRHESGKSVPEKNLETGISITHSPHEKNVVNRDQAPTADKDIVFDDVPNFPSIPMMMSVLPFLLPLAYPSRNNLPLLPLPPALQISDRLPVLDEGVLKNVEVPKELIPNEKASKVAQDLVSMILQKVAGNQLFVPTPLPSLPLSSKATNEKHKSEENPKVFDVMGKKYLMKTQTQEHPINGMGKFFIRFMSLRPLEYEVPPQADKNFEKEKPIEIKYRQPVAYNPDQIFSKKKSYSAETQKGSFESNFSPKTLTPEVTSSEISVEKGAQELKTMEPIKLKRKLSDDLITFAEPRTNDPEIPKTEMPGSVNISGKELTHNLSSEPKEDTQRKTPQTEAQRDIFVEPSSLRPIEKSYLKTEVKPSPIPVEGDVTASENRSLEENGRDRKVLNISDKNELLESKIVTIGYGEESPSIKVKENKSEASAETPKSQSEEVEEEIEKENKSLLLVPEKKKDSRKKKFLETSENLKKVKREEKYKTYKDKHSDDSDSEDED